MQPVSLRTVKRIAGEWWATNHGMMFGRNVFPRPMHRTANDFTVTFGFVSDIRSGHFVRVATVKFGADGRVIDVAWVVRSNVQAHAGNYNR